MDGNLLHPFNIPFGVKQGCNASPELFGMYIDRLADFIVKNYADLDKEMQQSIKVAGMTIHLLLFADDIVLISRTASGLERLLAIVGDFCDANGLCISIEKTKCLYVLGKKH